MSAMQLNLFEAGSLFGHLPAAPLLALLPRSHDEIWADQRHPSPTPAPRSAPTPAPTPAPAPPPTPPKPDPAPQPPDTLGAAIIAAGLAPNAHILSLNRCLQVPHDFALDAPWNLPSRLFRFPIRMTPPERRADGNWSPRTIGLAHPALADHPWVQHVERLLGFTIPRAAPVNAHGYSDRHSLWHHAVDLVASGHWRELLETQHMTTPDVIVGAVAYGLDYSPHEGERKGKGHLSTRDARAIMAALEIDAVGDTTPEDALRVCTLTENKDDKGKITRIVQWQSGPGTASNTWGRIIGIERRLLAYSGGHLNWTPAFKAERDGQGGALI